ncbi:phosphoglucosamine mutase [Gloeomargarita lithophora Alchichica-D10]|uniref:Phosphoglucosamine mutase n=1 Tax=Gloeomargarita lithophora Alchichica-D10 TaxID=1188229 RepID=A0A1J0ABF4_9CYAN|nr:hypothetical protein [Gloeomargarita lithophora]APB33267.1 phosphoglucosamine mutase [Gloeomargarita lithophora Alchichica-D10]
MTLKAGIAGLRGTVDQQTINLNPATILSYAQAFGRWVQAHYPQPTVVLGRDGRNSSPMVADMVRAGLLSGGCRVVDLGLTLTPTVQFTLSHGADHHAGVMVTASHNPPIWNGLKFLNAQGFFLTESDWSALETQRQHLHAPEIPLDRVLPVVHDSHSFSAHQHAVLQILPVPQIQARRFRVALDACNSGAVLWQGFLRALGCEVIACHTELHGYFSREPEPLPAHLETLQRLVRTAHCDLGFAADPDGDRLVLVDERGEAVNEEHTVVLCAQERLYHQPEGTVVVNTVTTHALESAQPGVKIIRTAVGEMNVVAGVQQHQAILGGEGSGGIIVPQVHLARDGMGAMGLILSLLATSGRSLSALIQDIPQWQSVKCKLTPQGLTSEQLRQLCRRWQQELPQIKVQDHGLSLVNQDSYIILTFAGNELNFQAHLTADVTGITQVQHPELIQLWQRFEPANLTVDTTDGIKLISPNAWFSLRPSNTEPIVRFMGEYRD